MFWGAWYSGVKWHSPFSWEWMKATLNPRIPLWSALVLVLLALIIPRLKVKRSLPPRVEGFWHLRNCHWFKDPYHQDGIVRSLEGMFTLRDSYESISIIRAYFKGGRAADSLPEQLYLGTDSPEKFTFSIASSPMEVAAGAAHCDSDSCGLSRSGVRNAACNGASGYGWRGIQHPQGTNVLRLKPVQERGAIRQSLRSQSQQERDGAVLTSVYPIRGRSSCRHNRDSLSTCSG